MYTRYYICRKMYGIQLAYKHVTCREDWEKPKTIAAGTKWESKVCMELAREYDICPEEEDNVPAISSADAEVRKALRDRALLSKALGTLGTKA